MTEAFNRNFLMSKYDQRPQVMRDATKRFYESVKEEISEKTTLRALQLQ